MIVFAALFLAYLFVAMNAVADDFFSRCISAITEHLGLSQNVAVSGGGEAMLPLFHLFPFSCFLFCSVPLFLPP